MPLRHRILQYLVGTQKRLVKTGELVTVRELMKCLNVTRQGIYKALKELEGNNTIRKRKGYVMLNPNIAFHGHPPKGLTKLFDLGLMNPPLKKGVSEDMLKR